MGRRRCWGYPLGSCTNYAGPRNPYWCDTCDKVRIETISKQLETIMNAPRE